MFLKFVVFLFFFTTMALAFDCNNSTEGAAANSRFNPNNLNGRQQQGGGLGGLVFPGNIQGTNNGNGRGNQGFGGRNQNGFNNNGGFGGSNFPQQQQDTQQPSGFRNPFSGNLENGRQNSNNGFGFGRGERFGFNNNNQESAGRFGGNNQFPQFGGANNQNSGSSFGQRRGFGN